MSNSLSNTTFQFSSSVALDIAKLKCKYYYWLFINASKIEPSRTKNWEKDLELLVLNWELVVRIASEENIITIN